MRLPKLEQKPKKEIKLDSLVNDVISCRSSKPNDEIDDTTKLIHNFTINLTTYTLVLQ